MSKLRSTNKKHPTGLPYGTGAVLMRGRVWWLVYKNSEGVKIQESSKTDDHAAAVRLLAEKALDVARQRVTALEELLAPKVKRPKRNTAQAADLFATMLRSVEIEEQRAGEGKAPKATKARRPAAARKRKGSGSAHAGKVGRPDRVRPGRGPARKETAR